MRTPRKAQGVCDLLDFHDPAYEKCIGCSRQDNHLDVLVPVTYSVHMGQITTHSVAIRTIRAARFVAFTRSG